MKVTIRHPGESVSGTGIQAGTTIMAVLSGTTFSVSAPAISTTSTSITFRGGDPDGIIAKFKSNHQDMRYMVAQLLFIL